MAANTRAVGEALEDAGAIVDEVAIPWNLQHIMATARRHYAAIFGAEIGGAAAAFGDLLNDYALAWAEEAQMYMAEPRSYLTGLEGEQEMWEPLGKLLRRYRALGARRGRSPASRRATASSGRSSTTAARTIGSSSAT